jgi:rare lipoprotein A
MGRRAEMRRVAGTTAVAGAILVAVAAGVPLPGAPEAPVVELAPQLAVPPASTAALPGPVDATAAAGGGAEPWVVKTLVGSASFYANSLAGRRTASGVPYRPRELVAAHPSLPFGTRLRVENLRNGRTVEVTVIDRGPFARGRILDLSRRAAEELDFIRQGHTRVRIDVLAAGGEPAGG